MKRTILFAVSLPMLVVSAVQAQSAIFLKKTAYNESKYGGEAFSALVPKNWKFNGNVSIGPAPSLQIDWSFHICTQQGDVGVFQGFLGQRLLWATESAGPVGQLLNSNFQGKLYQSTLVMPPMGAKDYYNQVIYPADRNVFQNYQVKEINLNPSLAQKVYHTALRDPVMGAMISSGLAQVQYEVLQIKAEFTVAGNLIEYEGMGVFEYLVGQNGFMTWGMSYSAGYYAPKGQRAKYDALFRAIASSGALNIEWMVKVERHRAQLKNIALDAQDYVRKTNEAMYWQKSQRQDVCFQNFSDALRGSSEYRDPFYDKPMWLPNTYNHIWTNANGDVILTDQVINPNEMNQYNRQEWRRTHKR